MNVKLKSLLKNISYTLSSNAITLVISVLLTLIVPKLLGTEEYAYWQLYVFYTSYLGFFHLGWVDGIYLKIGGENYDDIDDKNLGTQFWLLNIVEVIIAIVISIGALTLVNNDMKSIILVYTAICGVVTIAKTYLLIILQSTNRIKEYAKYTRYDRIIYFLIAVVYLLLGGRNFQFLIIADIISRLVVLLLAMNSCKNIVRPPFLSLKFVIGDVLDNIHVGSKLMFANIASTLIVGVIRMGIENEWNVTTFGKISLTLTISNLLITFINAIGIVLFPLLRKTEKNKLMQLYKVIRQPILAILYACLFLYYPARYILGIWLPKYNDALIYMAILFPMFIYESKMALLINTYLKTLRKEKTILTVNVISLVCSIALTFLFTKIFHSLFLTVFAVIIVLSIRCNLAEYLLAKEVHMNVGKEFIMETLLTLVFIFSSYNLSPFVALSVYGLGYSVYLLINQKGIKQASKKLKELARI